MRMSFRIAVLLLLGVLVDRSVGHSIAKDDQRDCSMSSTSHLETFVSRLTQPGVREWCNQPGEYVLFANQWVQVKIVISPKSLLIEHFQLVFFEDGEIVCTMKTREDRCNHPKIQVDIHSAITRVVYTPTDLQLTIVEHEAPIRYDIRISQGQFMDFRRPDGLCIDGSLICRRDKTRAELNSRAGTDDSSIAPEGVTFDQLSSEATTGPSAILFSSQSPTVVTESETSKSTTLLPTTDAILQTIATTAVVQGQAQSICHIYGDPHVIRFAAQPQDVQQQYWCRLPGQFQLFSNQFVRIDGRIRNGTWAIDQFNITLFNGTQTLSCIINSDEQQCSDQGVTITRPRRNQIDILYALPQIHISIVTHEYQDRWYDISIRTPFVFIAGSTGLCVQSATDPCQLEADPAITLNNTNALFGQICQEFIDAAINASLQLGLPDVSERYASLLAACIQDYDTTGNPYFGISMIDVLVKHAINRQHLPASEFESLTNRSVVVIENVITNVIPKINALTSTTTSTTAEPVTITSSTARPVTCTTSTPRTDSTTSITIPTTSTTVRPVTPTTSLPSSTSTRSEPTRTTTSACSLAGISMLMMFSVLLFLFSEK